MHKALSQVLRVQEKPKRSPCFHVAYSLEGQRNKQKSRHIPWEVVEGAVQENKAQKRTEVTEGLV